MLKYLLSLVLFLLPTAALACQPVQWVLWARNVQPGAYSAADCSFVPNPRCRESIAFATHPWSRNGQNALDEDLLYTVPPGKTLGITSVYFNQKLDPNSRMHLFSILGSFGVSSAHAAHTFDPPVRFPDGWIMEWFFTNNGASSQNMKAAVTGWLSDFEDLRDCPL